MTEHTPGPWREATDAQGICGLLHPTEHGVAVAWFTSAHTPVNGYVGDAEPVVGRPERQANAYLISAAPDLLAAAEELCGWVAMLEAQYEGVPAKALQIAASIDRARAAIAKARP